MCWLVGHEIAAEESWSVFCLLSSTTLVLRGTFFGTRVVFQWAVLRCTRGTQWIGLRRPVDLVFNGI
jgi:hypothetical protein